ncbi:MAG: hypothetical protein ACRCTZ_07870 [Sarcina sp.]
MKKVYREYENQSIVVDEVSKGINVWECDDIYVEDMKIEDVKNMLDNYLNDSIVSDDMNFKEFLDMKEIEWNYISDGYYTEDEFNNKYEDYTIVNLNSDTVETAQEYYDNYEVVYYYSYHDGSNFRDIDLLNEGEEVIHIKTLEENKDHAIELYYNIEEKELFTTFNSFYQGTLNVVEENTVTEEVEKEYKTLIEDIENLLSKIDYEIRHSNKVADMHEGFKIEIKLDEKELELLDYISSLYNWVEKEDDTIYISKSFI